MKASFFLHKFKQSALLKNSAYGLVANVLQNLFVSLFFVILARQYAAVEFGQYLIASSVYQLFVAFSAMGLGQWFIRRYAELAEHESFIAKFIKLQALLGLVFYGLQVLLSYALYEDSLIRQASWLLGANIVFDNVIYGIKHLNIAEGKQQKTFTVLTIDGLLKFLIACVLYLYPLSILQLSACLLGARFLTLNLFLKMGSAASINLLKLLKIRLSWPDVREQLLQNWKFAVIGSVSIAFWRVANILIAKYLSVQEVADFEIAFKVFTIMQLLPTVATATIFWRFVDYAKKGDMPGMKQLYQKVFLVYTVFALFSYAFIVSFSDQLIPLAFGSAYQSAVLATKEMFLSALLFPTVLLQANLLVAMKKEGVDMQLNIVSLLINLGCSWLGLYYFNSLSAIHYGVLIAFLCFHILQQVYLVRLGVTNWKQAILFYVAIALFVLGYHQVVSFSEAYIHFPALLLLGGLTAGYYLKKQQRLLITQ